MKKISILDMMKMKNQKIPISRITAYDFPASYAAEKAWIEMILIGDSGGMVQLGYETTNPVTMDEMIVLAKAVKKWAPNTFLVWDMPQGAYEVSCEEAIKSSLRFVKEAWCDAIKLEWWKRVVDKIKAIVDAGILVIGHLGLTPQSAGSFGGYRIQCKTLESFEKTIEDALAIQEAGACWLLLEAMPAEPAWAIAKALKIPVFGIGTGNLTDGQLIIMHDLLWYYPIFRPKFAKCYIPEVIDEFQKYIKSTEDIIWLGTKERADGLIKLSQMAIEKYIEEVKFGIFPSKDYTYPISDEELTEIKKSKYWK